MKAHMKIASLFFDPLDDSIAASAQDPVKVDPTHYRVLFMDATNASA